MNRSQIGRSSKTVASVTSSGLHLDPQFMRLHGLTPSGGLMLSTDRKPVENTSREFSVEEMGQLNGSEILGLLIK